MKTELSKIPVMQKLKIGEITALRGSSCCTPKNDTTVCCSPSKTKENSGNCCEQPDDGSVCCDK